MFLSSFSSQFESLVKESSQPNVEPVATDIAHVRQLLQNPPDSVKAAHRALHDIKNLFSNETQEREPRFVLKVLKLIHSEKERLITLSKRVVDQKNEEIALKQLSSLSIEEDPVESKKLLHLTPLLISKTLFAQDKNTPSENINTSFRTYWTQAHDFLEECVQQYERDALEQGESQGVVESVCKISGEKTGKALQFMMESDRAAISLLKEFITDEGKLVIDGTIFNWSYFRSTCNIVKLARLKKEIDKTFPDDLRRRTALVIFSKTFDPAILSQILDPNVFSPLLDHLRTHLLHDDFRKSMDTLCHVSCINFFIQRSAEELRSAKKLPDLPLNIGKFLLNKASQNMDVFSVIKHSEIFFNYSKSIDSLFEKIKNTKNQFLSYSVTEMHDLRLAQLDSACQEKEFLSASSGLSEVLDKCLPEVLSSLLKSTIPVPVAVSWLQTFPFSPLFIHEQKASFTRLNKVIKKLAYCFEKNEIILLCNHCFSFVQGKCRPHFPENNFQRKIDLFDPIEALETLSNHQIQIFKQCWQNHNTDMDTINILKFLRNGASKELIDAFFKIDFEGITYMSDKVGWEISENAKMYPPHYLQHRDVISQLSTFPFDETLATLLSLLSPLFNNNLSKQQFVDLIHNKEKRDFLIRLLPNTISPILEKMKPCIIESTVAPTLAGNIRTFINNYSDAYKKVLHLFEAAQTPR